MFTITAKCGLTGLKYLTGFYLTETKAQKALNNFSNYNKNYVIYFIPHVTCFPFYVLESKNDFIYFQDEDDVMEHLGLKKYNADKNGVFFTLYEVKRNVKNKDGNDDMNEWKHQHINEYYYNRLKKEVFI